MLLLITHIVLQTFLILSRSVLLRMRNVSDKSCRGNQNTHFVFSDFFYENRGVYEIIWKKNIVERGCPQMKIWRMRVGAGYLRLQTHTQKNVILIAFPLQQWLH